MVRYTVSQFILFLIILVTASTSWSSVNELPVLVNQNTKSVLVLYSFNNNVPTQQLLIAGINKVLNVSNSYSATFFHEYLDLTPQKSPNQRDLLRELILSKYAGKKFDLIVTYVNEALTFLLNEGVDLSPGSPCLAVFGVKRQKSEEGDRNVSYLPIRLDLQGTLERALELFPTTKRVVFVAGTSTSNQTFEDQARVEFFPWERKLEFDYTSNRSVSDLLTEVAHLPPESIIIYSDVSKDTDGRSFVPRDVAKMLAKHSNSPVFSIFSTQIETGVVGGSMLDVECVGATLASAVISNGDDIATGIDPGLCIIPMFNWQQVERWGASTNLLPRNSMYINRPVTIFEQHRGAVVSTIIVIFVLSSLTVILIVQNLRRKRAEILLSESAAQLLHERNMLEQRVTERTKDLSEALNFNETILIHSPLPMGVYTAAGQCVRANEAYAELVGGTRETLLLRNFNDIESWKKSGLFDDCMAALKYKSQQKREIELTTSFGKDVWIEYQIIPSHLNGEPHLLIQFLDLTKRKQIEDYLSDIAFHDSLTHLPNRRLLLDRLDQLLLLRKRQHDCLAVLFIDLNNFKQLNDVHGHDVGDFLLVEVACRLRLVVRESDVVARFGGDEFVVLLGNLGDDEQNARKCAGLVAEKICTVLSEEFILNGIRHIGSASVGIKICSEEDTDPDKIIKEADEAMYAVKKKKATGSCRF